MATDDLIALTEDERKLLSHLPKDGRTIGSLALRRNLGWDTDQDTDHYYAVRNALEDAGLILRGRGRGGTVRLAPDKDTTPVISVPAEALETPEDVEAAVRDEVSLYVPMRGVIAGDWAKDHRAQPIAVEITAQQGRRATGGIWSRPDIVSVEVRTFAYVPGKHIELVTFEVKPSNAISVQAVYESLAHRRNATHAYVLLHVPTAQEAELATVVSDVADVARTHGIGVVTAGDPGDYQTWEEREIAERVEPDPWRLDNFISTQLSESARRDIALRLR